MKNPKGKHTMSGESFTPGPWILDTRSSRPRVVTYHAARNHDVATILAQHSAAERLANAHLIAAAPELLAALVRLEPFLDAIVCYASDMDEHEPNRIAFEARAALAKAQNPPPGGR